MRVATFNILNGRSPADDRIDLARLSRSVQRLDADVLALQEVDRNQPRSRYADLAAVAAEAMGARAHRFTPALSGTPGEAWTGATGAEAPESPAYGIALLSRLPVTWWRTIRLPLLRPPLPRRISASRGEGWHREEPRVAVAARVHAPAGPITVVTTHLSFLPWWNRLQLRFLRRRLSDQDAPLVLLGDLNMLPREAAALSGLQPLASGPTFPWDNPREQLDHVLGSVELKTTHSQVVALPLSDHRALLADLGQRTRPLVSRRRPRPRHTPQGRRA